MSGGAVYRRALRFLEERSLCPPAVSAALDAASKGPQHLAYEFAFDTGLPREQILDRAAGVFLLFACLNLTDDLQDGDAGDYLTHAFRDGPAVALLLQNAATAAFAGAGVSAASLGSVGAIIARAAAGNLEEVATETWTADRYLEIAERIAADQWSSYLEALWSGTSLSPVALLVGRATGLLAHIREDLRTRDRRLVDLPPGDLSRVIELAQRMRGELLATNLRSARVAAQALDIDAATEGN